MSTDSKNLQLKQANRMQKKLSTKEKTGKKINLPNYNGKLYAIHVIDMNNTKRPMIVLDILKM